ncbi:MAG: DUF4339 domain-containing protein [Treponema sp.]|jgi:hypothetical protein|nr:DUF4339 domain-containing protein [Treponema sp.]
MKILKRPTFSSVSLLCVLFLICSSCASTKNTAETSGDKLVKPTALSAGEGEAEILITWSGDGDKNKTSYPLAVTMDWYESDDAMKAGNGEKGRLVAQIDRGESEKIIVKNGVVVLHFAGSMYNVKTNTWNAVESAKVKNFPASKRVPITLENNTITGTTVVTHPLSNLISIDALDAGLDWYPVNVKKAPLPGRGDSPSPDGGADSDKRAQSDGQTGTGQAALETRYNVAVENKPTGPFDMNELGQMAQKGRLTKESLVWREGLSQWEVAGNIPELAPLFQTTPASPPPAQPQIRYNAAFNGISSGPYTLEELKSFAEKGPLTRETLIWKEGASQWVAAGSIPEVAALIPQLLRVQPPTEELQPDGFSSAKFFILIDGQPSGPLSLDSIEQLIKKRQVARSSLVWREGLQQWVAAEVIPELANIFPVIPPPPPPQMPHSSVRYYIAVSGYPDGPFTMDELRQKLQSGQIGQRTLVWKEDMPQWAAMNAIPEFISLFTTATPAPDRGAPQTPPQEAPKQPVNVKYHVAVNGLSTGPFTIEDLKQKIQSGQLTRTTQVWKSGMTQWAPAGAIAELQPLF